MRIINGPKRGLLMMAVKDSFETDFYLGEILVTEIEVEYKDIIGYAMVIGGDDKRAFLIASVDALLQVDKDYSIEDLKKKVMNFISMQEKKIMEACEIEKKLVAKTKVNFEIMAKR
ncbi:MAG: phosphonate C-P lyase system protein PhnG [Thermodesulfovibrionales bacterium]|nr:phosphonate C-P lyase system protein PhnG [Thermodesulfovibrionales bacterium]